MGLLCFSLLGEGDVKGQDDVTGPDDVKGSITEEKTFAAYKKQFKGICNYFEVYRHK